MIGLNLKCLRRKPHIFIGESPAPLALVGGAVVLGAITARAWSGPGAAIYDAAQSLVGVPGMHPAHTRNTPYRFMANARKSFFPSPRARFRHP